MEGYRNERSRRVVGARQGDVVGVYNHVRRAVVINAGDRNATGERYGVVRQGNYLGRPRPLEAWREPGCARGRERFAFREGRRSGFLLHHEGRFDHAARADGGGAAHARAALRHEADVEVKSAICEFGRPLRPRAAVEEAEPVVLSVQEGPIADAYPLHGAAAATHHLVDDGSAWHAVRGTISGPLVLRAGPGARRCS